MNSVKTLINRSFDWGDNSPLSFSLSPVKHTYTASGTYTVTMTDYLSDGTKSVTTNVNYINVTNNAETIGDVGSVVENFLIAESSSGAGDSGSIVIIGGSSFPKETHRVGIKTIPDKYGQARSILFDREERIPYEVFTEFGTERALVYKDKVTIDLDENSGEHYQSFVKSRGAVGSLQRFYLEITSVNVYTTSISSIKSVSVPQLDENNVNQDSRLSVATIVDNMASKTQAQDLTYPRNEVGFDKREIGNVVQAVISFSKQPLILNGFNLNIISRDSLPFTDDRMQNESRWLLQLTSPLIWYTRSSGGKSLTVLGIPTFEHYEGGIGPDGSVNQLVFNNAGHYIVDHPYVSDELVSFWYNSQVDEYEGDPQVVMTKEVSDGWWYVLLQTSLNPPQPPIIKNLIIYDFRLFDAEKFDTDLIPAFEYYLKDFDTNKGDNVLPAWITI